MPAKALCIDIGGSKILTGILDEAGKVLYRQKRLLNGPRRRQMAEIILAESRSALENPCWKESRAEEVEAIGVSIPGLADREKGLWVYAPFSGIENFQVRELLWKAYRKPVFLDNDGNACAVGEKRFGCAKEAQDFLWLTVSNGVGAGLMLGGRLYEGAFRGAGELGHVRVADGGADCPCGGKGCLEAYAAGPGILRRYQEKIGKKEAITALEVAARARRQDAAALETFREEGFYLGKAIAMAVTLLNLPLAVIGGGVSGSFDLFEPEPKKTLREQLFWEANREFQARETALGYEAALIGAGALAFYGLEKENQKGEFSGIEGR